ncbi:hypothetical protein C7C46_29755 [Streptomyces tateyamensis]|uniref:Adhesin domain-containing protein n=1 Tax=Streptomyces tateyamensis TaxID=565073 RepID=A0A2V4MTY8_9ACTN|nr:hypothetical protein [Streptomyces tateyamensis]PYC68040.1 hypothetical protein C7C46_29755 [Streptomyces tateyamensis]
MVRAAPERRTWRLLAALSAALVLLLGAGTAWKVLAEQEQDEPFRYAGGITAVELDLENSSVQVIGEAGSAVSITQHERWTVDRPRVTRAVTGSTLHLTARCPRSWVLLAGRCGVQFALVVPPTTRLTAKGGASAVYAEGLTGEISARAGSGSVTLKRDSGPIAVRVDSGSVTGQELGSARVKAQADSGSVTLGFVQPPQELTLVTDSGSATATLPRGSGYQVVSSVGSGSSDVDPGLQDASSRRTITATTGSGSLSLGYGSG